MRGAPVAKTQSMGVAIRQAQHEALVPARDSWLDALTKLVPGEVIAAYTAVLQIEGVEESSFAQVAIVAALSPLAPLVLFASARRSRASVHPLQYVVRTLAFVLYALARSPGLLDPSGGLQWIAGAGMFVVSLLAALVIAPPAR